MNNQISAVPTARVVQTYSEGSKKLMWGCAVSVLTFWLFAESIGAAAPAMIKNINTADRYWLNQDTLNVAISLTALFVGIFIIIMGNLGDRIGHVRITLGGLIANTLGSAMILAAHGSFALPLIGTGRALQGIATACIMPATMALISENWSGKARAKAISIWAIAAWGGGSLSALFGGSIATMIGWRWLLVASIVVSAIAFSLFHGTPETSTPHAGEKFDWIGMILLVVGVASLMIGAFLGFLNGWLKPLCLAILIFGILALTALGIWERRVKYPFLDLSIFRNRAFTGVTVSNFFLNASVGMVLVSQQLIVLAGCKAQRMGDLCPIGKNYTAWDASLIAIGYAVFVMSFIRIGEKLLPTFGPRKLMLWGTASAALACGMLMLTHVLVSAYVVLAAIAYSLYGLGLALYATPSMYTALDNLPREHVGLGSGIYKMGSAVGAAIGSAVSLTLFSDLSVTKTSVLGNVIQLEGAQQNIDLRQAATLALTSDLIFLLLAALVLFVTLPRPLSRYTDPEAYVRFD
ncbi:MAG: MFS transporter [Actinomycetaceae bacterium]|nr:MFS transporter [Actinomycetaceae bacterium]